MLHLHFPNIPISVNQAYESQIVTRNKKRIAIRRLSDAGAKYKNAMKKQVLKEYPEALNFFVEDQPYLLLIEFTFSERSALYSKTWLDEDPKKRAKNRYKTLDVSNRTKLFEDALAEAVGIDDKHNFFVGVSKTWASGCEATDCWAFNRETERDNPIDELLRNLKSAGGTQPHRAVPNLP